MAKGELTVEDLPRNDTKDFQNEITALQKALVQLKGKRHYVIPTKQKGNVLRFGLISDTHVGSMYERTDALQAFYQTLLAEDIDICLAAGDIIDGCKMYRGQEFELYAHGYDKQEEALLERWPKTSVKTYFITGNHDYSYTKLTGMQVGEKLEKVMHNSVFVGTDSATVELQTASGKPYYVGLYHPSSGGTAYAISYKSQKLAESLPGGKKPDLLAIGHFHKADHMPTYRNMHILQAGTFQSQTPFMAGKGTPAHVGGWLIEVVLGDRADLTSRLKAEFIAFYEPEDRA